jgi:hypothetical protein
MKKAILIILLTILQGCKTYEPKNGDIIFHTSLSNQSKAIQLATNSPYSHMGIVYLNDGKIYVFEASKTVKLTPFTEWTRRGYKGRYVVKRLKNPDNYLTSENLTKLKYAGKKYEGKPYDLYFEWTDSRIYCSELVWKMYNQALGIEIGRLQELSDFDLENDIVKIKLKERYGDKMPIHEKVISPVSMFNSSLLITVFEN